MQFPPLYVLRHGQTEWNAEHRIQGRLDSRLTEQGRAEALAQRRIMSRRDLSGHRAFSSPQGRAFHTAALALDGLVSAIHTDPRLAEISVGDWEGLRRADVMPSLVADESEESALELYDLAPGGEGFLALHVRCRDFLATLSGPSVLVTHGITSRMLRLIVLGLEIDKIGTLPGGQGVVYHLCDGRMDRLAIGA